MSSCPKASCAPARSRFAKRVVAEKRPLRKVRDLNDKVVAARGKPEIFAEFRKANARKFRGFLAPEYNIRCIEAAVNLPFDEGLEIERKLFMELMTGPQSAAQRYVFFAERQVWKIPDVPEDTPTIPVKKVGIIGAGTMGGGIAMNFANVGIPVTIVETKQDALDRGLGVIRKNYETHREARQAQARGRREAHGPAHRLARAAKQLADCDLVIEAVFENMDVKKDVFGKLDRIVKQGAILATNTSAPRHQRDRERRRSGPNAVIGLHFFSPANVMRLLGDRARAEDLEAGHRHLDAAREEDRQDRRAGRRVPRLRRQPHAVRAPAQAQAMLMEGAMPWDIDKVLYEFGLPMGPFAMSDLAGLDIGWSKEKSTSATVREVLCEMDRRGQKTGAGFYDYDEQAQRQALARHREDHQGLHGEGRRDAAQDLRAGDPRALRVPDDQRGREDPRREDRDPPVGHRHRLDQRLRLARLPRRPDVLRRHRRA